MLDCNVIIHHYTYILGFNIIYKTYLFPFIDVWNSCLFII